MECVMFHATELYGQNGRLFRTGTVPVSDPDVSRPRLIRDASFLEADRREIALRRVSPEPSFSREPAVELDPTDAVVHSIAPPPNQLRCEAMIRARAPDGRGRRGGQPGHRP